MSILESVRAIDTDSHITEPADVWTARVASKWGDAVPHVRNVNGRDVWFIRDEPCGAPGYTSMAGFDGSFPDAREGFHDIPKSTYLADARLSHLDEEGIYAQVLYPNVGGFGSGGFLRLKEPELMIACVRAYNDFLVDWCSADSNRLIAVAAMPFWDIDECVKEVERVGRIGHSSVLACSDPVAFDMPSLAHAHWNPFWDACNDAGLPISFHIGAGDLSDLLADSAKIGTRASFAKVSSGIFMQNATCIADLIFGGVCHRYPELKFVSVESGIGWLPSFLETCDWQFMNSQVRKEHPEYDLRPSEYFRRQIYSCFWFEEKSIGPALELYPDNIMWETDFPHPTCQHPGPSDGLARHPRDFVEDALGGRPPELVKKVLHDTAAAIYGVE